jgi:hypothetical protein
MPTPNALSKKGNPTRNRGNQYQSQNGNPTRKRGKPDKNLLRAPLLAAAVLLGATFSAQAIVTSDDIGTHVVAPGTTAFGINLDGVVSFEDEDGTFASGVLISNRHILTAAAVIDQDGDGMADLFSDVTQARFDLPGGPVFVDIEPATGVLPPQWTAAPDGDANLGILLLSEDAPVAAPRYLLSAQTNEVGKQAVIVGSGAFGHGADGGFFLFQDEGRRAGLNRIDARGEDFENGLFDPEPGFTLVYDFDSGILRNNTLSHLGVTSDLGFGADEVGAYFGDFGGPVFIDGAVAAVSLFSIGGYPSDATGFPDASWGEVMFTTRVSSFRDFLTTATGGQAMFAPDPVAAATWNVDADGNWSQAGNWSTGVPNGAGAEAVFGNIITAPHTVTVDVPITVGRLDIGNTIAYTIAGAGALTLDAATGDVQMNIAGSHTISASLTLADNATINVTPAAGNLILTGALNADGRTLTKSADGALTLNNIRAAGLTINGGTVTIAPNGANAGTSAVGALTIAGATDAWTAKLDLTNNDVVVQSTAANKAADFSRLYNQVKQGFNNGTWAGLGITSSTAAANTNADTGLSLVDNALLGYSDFSGQTVTADSLLLKYTYYGDIDMNGQVDADDLTVFASNFGRNSGATQVDGDIDFNGAVNADDLTVFANNFNKGFTAPLSGAVVTAIPEPGTWILAACGICAVGVPVVRARRPRAP